MEGTDELHQNDDTQQIRRMMKENSSDPIPSLGGIDVLKVKSTVFEVNDVICNIRVKNLDEPLESWHQVSAQQSRCYCQQKRI